MNYDQFKNLSCYEEFEMKCTLAGISKVDVLYEIGYMIDDYFFFISKDGIFNWFDLEGNHIENPGILRVLEKQHIPRNITKCIIPDSIITIYSQTFYNCKSLKEITIPNSVTYIADWVFSHCDSLKEITIPDSVTSIGNDAFAFCGSLKEITFPNGIENIDASMCSCCRSLTTIIIPDSVTCIGFDAFWACKSLKEVIFKGKTLKEVKQMENYPFGIKDENIIKYES